MELKTFIDNFGMMAEAPNGIQKLREMILQLAVQGKLVAQDPKDEHGADLLKKILENKLEPKSGRKTRKGKPLQPLTSEECPFILPEKWSWARLGDISLISTGHAFKSPDYVDKGVFILRVTNIEKNGQILKDQAVFFPEDKVSEKIKAFYLDEGDILVVMVGGSLGKIGVVEKSALPALLNQNMWRINPSSPNVNRRFLILLLRYINEHQLNITNSTHGHLSMAEYRKQPVALPPFAEQTRIVAKFDELMALCDDLEVRKKKTHQACIRLNDASIDKLLTAPTPAKFSRHWQRIADNFDLLYGKPENVTKLRQAILQLAVQGKLVKQDPKDEPASVLLEKVRAEKERLIKEKGIRKVKPLPGVTGDECEYDLPGNWLWVRLDNLCYQVTDGTHFTPTYIDKGVPFLSVKDVTGGGISFSNTRFISEEEHLSLTKRCKPEYNDLLLTKVGTTGIARVINTKKEFSIFVSLALLKYPQQFINPYYFELLLNSPLAKAQSNRFTQGVGNKNLVLKHIRNFTLALPPIAEQKRIVAKVDQLMALCDDLEAKLVAGRDKNGKLLEAAVAELLAA